MRSLADEYLGFLSKYHADRERVQWAQALLLSKGFVHRELGDEAGLRPGDRFFYVNHHKSLIAGVCGTATADSGFTFVGAHGDYPHLDLKPNFVNAMKDQGVVTLKCHYFGGVKKYQQATTPMILKGFVQRPDGLHSFTVGDKPSDPVFTIPDLLIHLSSEQAERKMRDVVKGEELNTLAMSAPADDTVEMTPAFLALLERETGVTAAEVPFCEFQLFPAFPARFVGLDRSMIGGPGQDDGICVFTEMHALVDLQDTPAATAVACIYGYEETGSSGCTGAQSGSLVYTLKDVMYALGLAERQHARAFYRSLLVSADVTALFDPNFPAVHDKLNAAVMNRGIGLSRYTGSGGKNGSSEAPTELLHAIRTCVGDDFLYQFANLGRIDIGGGGTIAKFIGERMNAPVVDMGPGLLNMHSPFEVCGVADLWSAYEVYGRIFANHK
ncbi:Aminopeptidase I [Spironucleus salmonicida]|uniref:Aminopeptidase I n=1 Tax=Spironucleus salmonicida TaxID=348837 RepID=V6LZT0_9EUKA|nr:Aminopeptidase I [Spironucleus salmonicida]|eukprot:EST46359.1 M18 family aminopeptidase [Spironucleus salmonicida]